MTPATQDLHPLLSWITGQRESMLHDLGEYVRIETPSDDPQALAYGRDWIRTWIGQRLGEPVSERRESGDGPYGDTLVLDYPGTGDASTGSIVTLLAHYDTVWPLGTLDSIPFTVEDDTIRGPGVFDRRGYRGTGRLCSRSCNAVTSRSSGSFRFRPVSLTIRPSR